MLFSAMGSLGERIDTRFLSAYFLPAFVAMLGTLWILEAATSDLRPSEALLVLNTVQQAVIVLLLLLATLMLAFLLRTLSRPITALVTGRAIPRSLRAPMARLQQRNHRGTATVVDMVEGSADPFPLDPRAAAPTRFGNVMASASDYPRLMYAMEALYWWPRLLPLLPEEFQDLLRSVETPMRAMLNLGLVSFYLGVFAAAALVLSSSAWGAAAALIVGVVLAEFFYRAAVSQASELIRNIWVAFDLYRSTILEQLGQEMPGDIASERSLWTELAARLRVFDAADARAAAGVATRCAPPAAAPDPAPPGAAPPA